MRTKKRKATMRWLSLLAPLVDEDLVAPRPPGEWTITSMLLEVFGGLFEIGGCLKLHQYMFATKKRASNIAAHPATRVRGPSHRILPCRIRQAQPIFLAQNNKKNIFFQNVLFTPPNSNEAVTQPKQSQGSQWRGFSGHLVAILNN